MFVVNGSESPITVTVVSAAADTPPIGPSDLEVTIAAGASRLIDISDSNYNDAGDVNWTYSDDTTVTAAVVSGLR